MPLSFSIRHAYLGIEADNNMLRNTNDLFIVTTTPTDHHERREDCSGRSMATLLVAWVSAAMVASILLRWKYMWIALAILTILFLIACGLAAYSSRKNTQREEEDDEEEESTRREQSRFSNHRINIPSISSDINYRVEPPAYQTYWITELPPPYTVVIGSDSPPLLPPQLNSTIVEESSNITMDPPPYSIAIQQNHTSIQMDSSTDHTNTPALTCQPVTIKEETDDGSKPPPNVLSTGTQYFSNFISNTFGRGRRTSTGIVIISTNQESTSCSRTEQTTS